MEGVKDTFRHFWLVFRCSIIGVFVGIMPGAGGGVAQWMAYAHAVQSAKDSKERGGFGKGDVRGVLGSRRGEQFQRRRRADSDHRLRRAGERRDGNLAQRLF